MYRIIILCIVLLYNVPSYGFTWKDLWWRHDQQATKLMQQGKMTAAAERFDDKAWQAVAYYRAGEYEQAAKGFRDLPGSEAQFNLGNALAHLQEYEAAINAYDTVLAMNPNHTDAQHNKALLEKILAENPQQQQPEAQADPAPQSSSNNDDPKKSGQDANHNGQEGEDDNTNNDTQQDNNQEKQQAGDKTPDENAQEAPASPEDNTPTPQEMDTQAMQPKSANGMQPAENGGDETAQALNQIPDDPGSLLRQKFIRDYLKRHAGRMD